MSTLARFDQCHHQLRQAAMAEWLRRLTRNQMGSSRVGSNPTRSVEFSNQLAFYRSRLDENDHDGIRTHNLLIRSQTPYPLGHATDNVCSNPAGAVVRFRRNSSLSGRLGENDHDGIRTHNLLIRSQTPYPLGHATDGHCLRVRTTGIHGANNETQQ